MYNIAICDNDINFLHHIKNLLFQSGISENETTFIDYLSGNDFINDLEQISEIDLLILDIQLPDNDGDEVAKHFREYFPSSLLVLCSGIYNLTIESFSLNPFRYLLKEYANTKMIDELKVIVHELKTRKTEPYILGMRYHNHINLRPTEILYISVGRNCTELHINPEFQKYAFENKVSCKEKLNDLYNLLKDYNFEYAHNSYLVNLQYIKRKTTTELELIDGTVLTISRSREKTFRQAFVKYTAKKYNYD